MAKLLPCPGPLIWRDADAVQALAPWAALAGVAWLCHRTRQNGETLRDVRSIVTATGAHLRALRVELAERRPAMEDGG